MAVVCSYWAFNGWMTFFELEYFFKKSLKRVVLKCCLSSTSWAGLTSSKRNIMCVNVFSCKDIPCRIWNWYCRVWNVLSYNTNIIYLWHSSCDTTCLYITFLSNKWHLCMRKPSQGTLLWCCSTLCTVKDIFKFVQYINAQ